MISAVIYGLFAILAELLFFESVWWMCQEFQENPDGGYTLGFSPNVRAIPYVIAILLVLWALVLCILRAVKTDFSKAWLIVTSASVAGSIVCFFSLNPRRMIFSLVTSSYLGDDIVYLLTSHVNIVIVTVSVVLIVEAIACWSVCNISGKIE